MINTDCVNIRNGEKIQMDLQNHVDIVDIHSVRNSIYYQVRRLSNVTLIRYKLQKIFFDYLSYDLCGIL
jgi:hypothetical protein